MAELTYGLRIPAVHPANVDALRSFVTRAEDLGFDSIWVGDHVFFRTDVLQPLHLLTWVAAQTTRVRLGQAVMLSAYLNPVLLARDAASLDYLSRGRLMLGMSIGGSSAEYSSIGVPMNQRVGRLIENVEIMRRLWREDAVEFTGRYHTIEGGSINPKPAQSGGVPVYFGANGDAMLRRIARVADGWIGGGSPIARFLAGVKTLHDCAEEFGRDPESLGYAKLQGISVAKDAATAKARAETQWKSYYGPNFDVEAATIYGTPADCAAKLDEFTTAQCSRVTLALEPPSLDLEYLEMLAEITVNRKA
ncbi:MAG TPA: LLM class flavin-dependent oxidoreductase [Dehalococcoidia bacterium]|nr:LLM class flavin-dependent oxidoreductase [Dehalococcoidia bacterium]